MRTIPAREIERHGIRVVDDALEDGPVHVIRNDEPCYVIMSEEDYRELLEDREEAQLARIKESIEDVKAGRIQRSSAQEIIVEFGLETDV